MDNLYAAVSFTTDSGELLSLYLTPYEVLSIEERDQSFIAYWEWNQWLLVKEEILSNEELSQVFAIKAIDKIEQQNWNQKWEESFEPIEVEKFCRIRASFHEEKAHEFQYEILIDPKMSFGTGHHATTWQMIQMMKDVAFNDKRVLDYGCGTGILAILALKMGATGVWAFDNDEWAYNNALENGQLNQADAIQWSVNTLDTFNFSSTFDIILANINRNVLLESSERLAQMIHSNGHLLLSGFYESDLDVIMEQYSGSFDLQTHSVKDNWCCAVLKRKMESMG